MQTLTAEQFLSLHAQRPGLILIDVRSPAEFRTVHVQGAINVPLGELNESALAPHAGKDDEVFLICHTGGRASKACEQLRQWGYTRLVNVTGGTVACEACNAPVNRGRGVMSIERQVRIVAGSLVLLGVILSLSVVPACIWLSAFVGAGLVFAGVSDTCMMGLLLAKMPWNR